MMPQELEAVFDGTALQLEAPLNLAAGTRVRIVVESVLPNEVKPPKTFLKNLQRKADQLGFNLVPQPDLV
jgi:hypothetical protein